MTPLAPPWADLWNYDYDRTERLVGDMYSPDWPHNPVRFRNVARNPRATARPEDKDFEDPTRGDEAVTTVEARGCPRPTVRGAVSVNPDGEMSGRAAGALLTGQRQDGQSQVPVSGQYPGGSHGAAGPNLPPFGDARLPERFWAKAVETAGGCWTWQGAAVNGYGRFQVRNPRRSARAHRVAYEHLVGPIPEGLEIDHTCRNRGCVNPAHLEAVTRSENMRRGAAFGDVSPPTVGTATHCRRGHEYTPENTFQCPDGSRRCRTCRRASRYPAEQPDTPPRTPSSGGAAVSGSPDVSSARRSPGAA